MDSVISNLLDELETELSEAKKSMILGGKAIVDTDACLGILDELRETLPTEIERAGNIMRERRQILIDAEEEAKQCILAAQKTADEMVQEHEITRNAEIEGKKIKTNLRLPAREVTYLRYIMDSHFIPVKGTTEKDKKGYKINVQIA